MGWKQQQKIAEARAKARKEKEKTEHIKKRKRHRSRTPASGGSKETREIVNRKVDQEEQAHQAKALIKEKPKAPANKKKVRT